jgi:hypothetical protein
VPRAGTHFALRLRIQSFRARCSVIEIDNQEDLVHFGDISPRANALLQQGVAAYPGDPDRARALFRHAAEIEPETLPAYRCLFKLHNRQRDFEAAREVALEGMAEAARQAGVTAEWRNWTAESLIDTPVVPHRFLLQFLKAIAFIELRRGNPEQSRVALDKLIALDPADGVGGSVVAALLAQLEED